LIAFCGISAGMLGTAGGNVESSARQGSFSPNDIKIVGTIDNGNTSPAVQCSPTPKYRALVFEATGNDRVQVTVTGTEARSFVALADSTLTPIASGTGQLSVILPYRGPDLEAYYIVFKSSGNQPARLSVHLKTSRRTAPASADATR
jgi:hypothetical protein